MVQRRTTIEHYETKCKYLKEVKQNNPFYDDLTVNEDKKNLSIDVLTDINNQIEKEEILRMAKNS